MAFRPHRFGRYIIVDPVAVGGMAEIYRARLAASKEGPDRVIVIKKVIANLSQNPEFVQMFEEEIKITVGLTHPNIIQIYDYGKVDDQYFMAMEYVEGKNLRQFVKRLADMKSMFSIDMSCYIISQVCHALAYAHAYKDRMSGKPLGIVHRDISPQNVMISYDGATKLFDFGIAKAKSASEATRAGVIKGKPSYLSPEQIAGEVLDGRCDIFALGIVLWELLTAKRLFVADTDIGVLRLIQSAKIEPPSTFNPAVPQALDAIVLKSLHRDKLKRYQTAEEFQRDLHKFLYSFNASFNPADLSYYAQELFKTEIKEDKERLAKYLAMEPVGDAGQQANLDGSTDGSGQMSKKSLSTKLADGLVSTTDFNRELMDQVAKENTGKINRPSLELMSTTGIPKPKASPPMPGTSVSNSSAKTTNPPSRKQLAPNESMVIPPWTKQSTGSTGMARAGSRTHTELKRALDEPESSGGRNVAVLMVVLVLAGVFAARQYGMLKGTPLAFLAPAEVKNEPQTRNIASTPSTEGAPQNPDTQLNNAENSQPQVNAAATEGIIVLQTTPDARDFRVSVNGRPVVLNNNQFTVPLNTDLKIEVNRFRFERIRFATRVTDTRPVAFRLDFKELPSGILFFSTTPDAKFTFYLGNDKIAELGNPVKNQPMPAGNYRVVIENSLLNYHSETQVVIEPGKITRIEKTLK